MAGRGSSSGLVFARALQASAKGPRVLSCRNLRSVPAAARSLATTSPRLTNLATFKSPKVFNEPNVCVHSFPRRLWHGLLSLATNT